MKIILASKSPRRIDLLKTITSDFEVIPSKSMEILDLSKGIEEGMKTLAYEKAYDVFKVNPDSIVIGSDTLIFFKNHPIGKPKDRDHAREILGTLRGKSHYVYTSVALISKDIEIKLIDKTELIFKNFSNDDLEEFLDTNIWTDKSGAYAIQSLDERYVQSINGDTETVIGFPTTIIKDALKYIEEYYDK